MPKKVIDITKGGITSKAPLSENEKIICPNCSEETKANVFDAFWCNSCERIIDEDDATVIYECNNCGETFSREESYDGFSHKCPNCGRFGSVLTENACPDCYEELEEVEVVECEKCREVFRLSDAKTRKEEVKKKWEPLGEKGDRFVSPDSSTFIVVRWVDRKNEEIVADAMDIYAENYGVAISTRLQYLNNELLKNWKKVSYEEYQELFDKKYNEKAIEASKKYGLKLYRCKKCGRMQAGESYRCNRCLSREIELVS